MQSEFNPMQTGPEASVEAQAQAVAGKVCAFYQNRQLINHLAPVYTDLCRQLSLKESTPFKPGDVLERTKKIMHILSSDGESAKKELESYGVEGEKVREFFERYKPEFEAKLVIEELSSAYADWREHEASQKGQPFDRTDCLDHTKTIMHSLSSDRKEDKDIVDSYSR